MALPASAREKRAVFPAPGRPGDRGQPAGRAGGGEVVQVVPVADLDLDVAAGTGPRRAVRRHRRGAGQERARDRARVGFQLAGGAFGNRRAAGASPLLAVVRDQGGLGARFW
jgi:hypothetical protein